MKIVLDTNVLISAIFWKGPPNQILRLAQEGKITLIASQEILGEFFNVVSRAKFAPYLHQAGFTPKTLIQGLASSVRIIDAVEPISGVSTDPSDDKFLACAIASSATFLISGDKHLLKLKSFRGIPILTPAQFLKRF